MQLTLKQIAGMCGGNLSAYADPDMVINDVVIDSRAAKPGSLFVAIKGEKHDGINYIADAFANGASATLVHEVYAGENAMPLDIHERLVSNWQPRAAIYVTDTVKALGILAQSYRSRFDIPVVAITGSNGKTTVKEMLKSICSAEFGAEHVLATSGNLNNHLGMPLTLLKLNEQHKVAIIEMGMNHAGELDYLSRIAKPTIAVVNNVMLAHAGFFNDLNDIAKAKGEIYNGLSDGGVACVNVAIPEHHMWYHSLQTRKIKIIPYGIPSRNDVTMGTTELQSGNKLNPVPYGEYYINETNTAKVVDGFTIVTPDGNVDIQLQILGEHNQKNALTAATLAVQLGCSLKNIAAGLSNYHGYKRRLERKTAFNGALIIDDSYNANPESVKAAIVAIKDLPKPHWFIFASLGELGKFADSAHKEIGEFAAKNGIDKLITYGDLAALADKTFGANVLHFNTCEEIIKYCRDNLPKAATLLVKGSNSMNLDRVIDKLL